MTKVAPIDQRKADHIKINLEQDVRSALTTGLENYHFTHEALPELDLNRIDTTLSLFGKQLAAPILISSMTGGTAEAEIINLRLAGAAQELGVAMGVGSQRAAIEHPEQASTFQVRRVAPAILLFANLGAVQLNYGYSIDQCRRAVDMIEADALILHLNPLQEAVQDGGDVNFAGLAKKIEEICKKIKVPVIAKEVGWGISEKTAKLLADVYDRYRCRMEELRESNRIIRQCLDKFPAGPFMAPEAAKLTLPSKNRVLADMESMIHHFVLVTKGPVAAPRGEIYAAVESPKGELGFYIVSNGEGKPYRLRLRTPSFVHASALPALCEGSLLADMIANIGTIDIVMGDCDR